MSEEVLARMSRPGRLFLCLPVLYLRMELSIANVHYNGNTYGNGIEVYTDTVTLIIGFVAGLTVPVFTCRRFDSGFCRRFGVAVLTCRLYDLSPF